METFNTLNRKFNSLSKHLKILAIICGMVLFANFGWAQLAPGDIAIIQYNADATPDNIKFVALADVAEGEVIYFTDNGWLAANSWRTGEGIHTYTVPAGGLSAGDVVYLDLSGPTLSTSGDQIIAYQNTSDMIFGLNNDGAAVWQADATSANTSALPQGLTNGTTAVALTEIDNAMYNGATTGTKAELLALIGNKDNWVGSDATVQNFTGTFTVSGGAIVATQLIFVIEPVNTEVNVAMSDVTVKAVDASNNIQTDYSTSITISSDGTLTGDPVSGTWSNGVATFTGLTHTVVGTGLTLTASSGTLTDGVSAAFNITAAAPPSSNETVNILAYNLLNYVKTAGTGDCDQVNNNYHTKGGYIKTLVNYSQPDIFGVEEIQGGSGGQANADEIHDSLLNILNASSYGTWARLPYSSTMGNEFISNQLYWNTEKFTWQSTSFIDVSGGGGTTRDVPVVQLRFYKNDNTGNPIDIYVLVAHTTPEDNAGDAALRASEMAAVRTWLDANLATGQNIVIMGDLNLYRDTEAAYQNLTTGGDADTRFYDPINRPGAWTSNSSFADIHTQCTRLNPISTATDPLFCGSTGGGDDRFDFILATAPIINGTNKISYVSYETIGQDGNHYNQDINNGANSSSASAIVESLYQNSDHLPVKCVVEFECGATLTSSVATLTGFTYVEGAGPSANQTFTISGSGLVGTGDITVTGTSSYEVSTDGSSFSASVTYPYASGEITGQPKTVYVRLKAGLALAAYDGEIITIAGGSATTINVTCDGDVTSAISCSFGENFDRADNTTIGNGWTEVGGNADITSNALVLSGDGVNGLEYIYQDVNTSYETTFGSSASPIKWEFNMRTTRPSPSGLLATGYYGVAFVLGNTNSDFTLGNGYAVIIGNSGDPDNIKLVRFTGGLDGTITDMIQGIEPTADYASVRVTFDPATNTWELFTRDDGATGFASPATLAAGNSNGTLVNTTYTSSDLPYIGCYWAHATGLTDIGVFDNICITSIPVPTLTVSTTSLSGYTYVYQGGPSTSQNFALSGANLDGSQVVVSAGTNYQVSLDNTSFSNSVNVNYTAPTLASTTIYVRLVSGLAVGTYNGVLVTCNDNGTAADNTITNNGSVTCKPQTITFGALANKTYGDAGFALTATASSGLGVTYTSSNTAVATISGSNVTIVGAGISNITASQAGDANNCAATNVIQSLTVNQKALTVSGAGANNKTYDGTNAAVVTGSLSGIVGADVVSLVGTGTFASVNAGTGIAVTSTSTLAGADAGNYTLTQPTGLTADITKATQTITFPALADVTTATPDYDPGATSSVGLTITYTSSDPSVATIVSGNIHVVGIGTCNITASQPGDANAFAAVDVVQSLTVNAVSATADDIIISELCDPTNNYTTNRYIEIFNPTSSTIDLTGCKVEAWANGALYFTWNLSGTIGSCTALTCGDVGTIGYTPDFSVDWTTTSWNGGVDDGAKFKNSSGTVIDVAIGLVHSDKSMVRNSNISTPNTTFTVGEWTVTSVTDVATGASTPSTHVNDGCMGPLIITSESSLSGFVYDVGSGPSESQSYTVSASNLVGSGNIVVTCPANYEISLDDASFVTTTLSLPFASGIITAQPTTIYVRLKAGLSVGAYDGFNISHAGGTATTVNVTCNGDVLTPADMYISEVAGFGLVSGTYNNEYIELVNNLATPQSLDGWQLLYYENGSLEKTITFGSSDIAAANSAFVVAVRTSYTGALIPDYVPATSFSINGGSCYVVLKDNTGTIKDEGGSSTDPFDCDYNYEFTDCGNDNKPASNWTNTDEVDGTPGVVTCIACITPTISTTSLVFSNVTGSSIDLDWTNGNGTNRIIIARASSDVSITPVDGTTYSALSIFSDATDLGSGNKCVYNGSGTGVTVSGLTGSTVYYFKIFEYNCSPTNEMYGTALSGNQSTDLAPVTGLEIVCQTNSTAQVSWIAPAGDYTGVIIGVRNSTLTPHTVSGDATTYVANTVFGTGYEYGSTTPKSYVVFNGVGTSVTVTGLTAGQPYTFEAYAYKNSTGTIWASTKPTTSIATLGTINVTGQTILIDNSQLQLQWNAPDLACYDEVMIVANDGAAITSVPSGDGSAYTADLVYGNGDGYNGGFIVYKGVSSPQMVTGLSNGTEYCFTWFVRNGTDWSTGVSSCATPANITILYPGDLAIIAVNTQAGAGSDDEICFFSFKTITSGTAIDFTDNGYERLYEGKWADSEGTIRLLRTGPDIPAGQTICFQGMGNTTAGFDMFTCGSNDNGDWTITSLNSTGSYDLNVDDQIWIMQGGSWNYGSSLNDHNAVYTGNILYGWTATGWKPSPGYNSTAGSTLFPNTECFNTDVTVSADHDKVKYIGDMSETDQSTWITRINDDANWIGYAENGGPTGYESGPDYVGSCITFPFSTLITIGSDGIWTGAANEDWFDCKNWENLRIPNSGTNVIVSGDNLNHITIDDGIPSVPEAECNSLSIASDTRTQTGVSTFEDLKLKITHADAVLNVYSNFENNKIMQHTLGTVKMVGTSPQTITVSSNADNFYNLEIAHTSTGVTLNNSITISNVLAFTEGKLLTGANTINISNTSNAAIVGGVTSGTDKYIEGKLQWNTVAGTYTFPVGYSGYGAQGFGITVNSGNGNVLGFLEPYSYAPIEANAYCDFEIRTATDQKAGDGTCGTDGILDQITFNVHSPIQWDISNPSGGTISNYDLTVYPNGAQDISSSVATTACGYEVKFLMKNGEPGNTGTTSSISGTPFSGTGMGICPSAGTHNSLTGLTGFSKFNHHGASKASTALPVELLYFDAVRDGKIVNVNWGTATERNNDYFTVERSRDAKEFDFVTNYPGAGNSLVPLNYSIVDYTPFTDKSYYRLKQTDIDGSSTYSKVVTVVAEKQKNADVNITKYQNTIQITIDGKSKSGYYVEIVDMLGRVVFKEKYNSLSNKVMLDINCDNFMKGIYHVAVFNEDTLKTTKIIF